MDIDQTYRLFMEPPPRPISDAVHNSAVRNFRVLPKFIGTALTCMGMFYLPIFALLKAPKEIMLGFSLPPIIGIVLLVSRFLGKKRIRNLLATGIYGEGKLTAITKPGPGEGNVPTSYQMTYRFRAQNGETYSGSAWFLWRKELQTLNAGDAVPACYNPLNPRVNFCLSVIPPSSLENRM
ncbi:MAG: DUF3592 domain-containing protein [bacterium]|nr:DUF3592 domain-containing protein [bacterium]